MRALCLSALRLRPNNRGKPPASSRGQSRLWVSSLHGSGSTRGWSKQLRPIKKCITIDEVAADTSALPRDSGSACAMSEKGVERIAQTAVESGLEMIFRPHILWSSSEPSQPSPYDHRSKGSIPRNDSVGTAQQDFLPGAPCHRGG